MSHIVEVKTQVRDPIAVAAACRRLGLTAPTFGCFRLFNSEAQGLGVQLPNWRYAIVVDTMEGSVRFDNYNGAWGDQADLNRFFQAYSVEKATIEARKKGHSVREQALEDGSIKLTLQVGGHS